MSQIKPELRCKGARLSSTMPYFFKARGNNGDHLFFKTINSMYLF